MHQQLQKLTGNWVIAALFFVLVAILSGSFSQWGMTGIFFAVLGSAVILGGGAVLLKVITSQTQDMINGKPNRMDHLLSPAGQRRRRYTENWEEYAEKSVVTGTPYRPLKRGETVDATPTRPARNAARTDLVSATTTRVTVPQDLRHKNQWLRAYLELALNFNPPYTQIIGRALLCLGQRGSGKSNFAALFVEQMCKLFLPAVIFDYLLDFDTLPEVLPNCRIGGYSGWAASRKYEGNYWEVDIENAEEVGYLIRENGGQIVIEIPSYPDNAYAAQVIQGVIQGMYSWGEARDPKKRLPALVVLDEAQQFLPQNVQDTEDKEVTQRLLRTFKRLNEIGRHYGLTPALFTQRAARINKDVIGGTEIYVLMRQTMPQDLEVCEKLIGKENVDRKKIAGFGNGDALIFEGGASFQVHFDLRQSEHKSTMPDPEKAIARYQGREVQRTLTLAPPSDEDGDLEEDEEIETGDLQELELQPIQGASSQTGSPEEKLSKEELLVMNTYQAGHKTGLAIAAVTGLTATKVNQCLNKLSTLELIDWKPRGK